MNLPRHCRNVVCSVALLILIVSGFVAEVPAADSPADYPGIVVTVASIDRILDRGVLLTELAGSPLAKERILAAITSKTGDRTLNGIDLSKPIGMIVLLPLDADKNADTSGQVEEGPKVAEEKKDINKPDESNENDESTEVDSKTKPDEFDEFFGRIERAVIQSIELQDPERWLFFIPISDFDSALKSLGINAVPGKPGRYAGSDGDELSVDQRGNYIVFGKNADRVAVCPDLESVVPRLLNSNDLVVSFKAMPNDARARRADAIKLEFAKACLQGKDETPNLYALRLAVGGLVAELLDLAISHVDEVNLAMRIDPDHKRILSEVNLVGPENGELAKSAAEWAPKRRVMQGLEQQDGPISYHVAFGIPERHSKPIGDALRDYARHGDGDPLMKFTLNMMQPLVSAAMSLIESGDFEFLCTCFGKDDTWNPILGIKVPGGPEFPAGFQSVLNLVDSENRTVKTNKDAMKGVPIHLVLFDIFPTFFNAIGEFDGWCWLAATPDAIWLAASTPESRTIPDELKVAIKQTSSKTVVLSKAVIQDLSFFRMVLHLRHWNFLDASPGDEDDDAKSEVQQANLEQSPADATRPEQAAIQVMFREKADGVFAELRPSPNGMKLTIQWDEAFLALCGKGLVQLINSSGDN